MGEHCQAVDEGNDDVLDIDILQQLSTRLQEGIQGLEMELIGEHLGVEGEEVWGRVCGGTMVCVGRGCRGGGGVCGGGEDGCGTRRAGRVCGGGGGVWCVWEGSFGRRVWGGKGMCRKGVWGGCVVEGVHGKRCAWEEIHRRQICRRLYIGVSLVCSILTAPTFVPV